jgi:hypothetical protein
VWLEWQFPQARTKTRAGSELNTGGGSWFLGCLAKRCTVSACPIMMATVVNANIDFNVLVIAPYLGLEPLNSPRIFETSPMDTGGNKSCQWILPLFRHLSVKGRLGDQLKFKTEQLTNLPTSRIRVVLEMLLA